MNITDEEMNKLKEAKTKKEWNMICDKIKETRNGEYPPDWYQKVIATGLVYRKLDQ